MTTITPVEISTEFHPALSGKSELHNFDQEAFDDLMHRAFKGRRFSYDWFSSKAPPLFHHLKDKPIHRILEVGVFEGRSALFFAALFPDAHLTLVDLFIRLENEEQPYETNFDYNTRDLMHRITKIKKPSPAALSYDLINQRYELVYVDADHGVGGCLIDAILSWRLLEVGGYLLFDDYDWIKKELHSATRRGINAFIDLIFGCFEVVHANRQVLLRKTEDVSLLQIDEELFHIREDVYGCI